MSVLMSSQETEQLDRHGHVEIGTDLNLPLSEQPPMAMWVSRGLMWIAAPEGHWLHDDQPMAAPHGLVVFRRLDAEWLTWLRQNYLKNKDARSSLEFQKRMRLLSEAIEKYVPHLVGADVVVRGDYEPPLADAVSWARS